MYKLLVVDDEPIIRKGIKTLINMDELNINEVFEATNGKEGLEQFIAQGPELVLLDINMPKMNGLELARRIKAIEPRTKIALITGYDYFDYAMEGIKIGVDDYVLKPISKKDVIEVLTKLIDKVKGDYKELELNKVVSKIVNSEDTDHEESFKEHIIEIVNDRIVNADFSLTVLADTLGFSSSYLSTLFKKEFGISFQDYVLEQRLERSKLLLLSTDLKNYEIAERIGFIDVNYFGARFKKKYGVSPKQYKSKVGEGHED